MIRRPCLMLASGLRATHAESHERRSRRRRRCGTQVPLVRRGALDGVIAATQD